MKKVCVIGASGLLGNKLTRLIADYDVFGTFNQAQTDCPDVQLMKLDITKYEECESILKIRPDFIVNTAAITNVDYCEKFQEKSYLVNVRGTANLVKIANKLECKLIQISTDGVFSGEKGNVISGCSGKCGGRNTQSQTPGMYSRQFRTGPGNGHVRCAGTGGVQSGSSARRYTSSGDDSSVRN